jgi:hypothetical protein
LFDFYALFRFNTTTNSTLNLTCRIGRQHVKQLARTLEAPAIDPG